MPLPNARFIKILLIEDNPGDVLLTKEAFAESKIKVSIDVATNGEMALKMLYKEEPYSDLSLPDLILLDLNIPKISGHDVLKTVKEDPKLKSIPVIVMTGSDAETDVIQTYGSHANSYIVKPVEMNNFFDIVKSVEHFWFSIVVLPSDIS